MLIDTVDHKFSREFVQNLRREIDLADLDYIVINHAEEDHAGALTELMMQIPDTPIYCTANAINSIRRPPSSSGVELPRGENRRYSRHR